MDYELGYCTGPCRGVISPGEYEKIVSRVEAFLEGDKHLVVERIHSDMEKASTKRNYEKAARLRDRIRLCGEFSDRQRFFHKFKTGDLVIHEGGREAYRFSKGWLKEVGRPGTDKMIKSLLGLPKTPSSNDPRFLLDRANIVHRWIKRQKNGCEYFFDTGSLRHGNRRPPLETSDVTKRETEVRHDEQ
jgi:hypothetical protein